MRKSKHLCHSKQGNSQGGWKLDINGINALFLYLDIHVYNDILYVYEYHLCTFPSPSLSLSISFKRYFVHLTENTKSLLQKQRPPLISSNEELKEILANEISIDKVDPTAINDICKEFLKFGIEVPSGYSQSVIPRDINGNHLLLAQLKDKFYKLQLECKRIKWV